MITIRTLALCATAALAMPVCGQNSFAGRWDITLSDGAKEFPSWIEIAANDGKPAASFVGRWGNARPLPRIEIAGNEIEFVSPKREEGGKEDMLFKGHLADGRIQGTANGPDGNQWSWIAVPAPGLGRSSASRWGEPIVLFNGWDLTGWRLRFPDAQNGWTVEQGILQNHPPSADLVTEQQFTDFKLHIEFNCPKGCNSGVYLRGRYEVQIEDDSTKAPATCHMGGIYGFLAPAPEMPRRPGEWQSYDVVLVGRHVSVAQNGVAIITDREIPGITGGALDSREALAGPIFLQGDHGSVSFRNIVVTPALP
jgi:hypothetical protein